MKRIILAIVCIFVSSIGHNAFAYDFYAIAPSGQTLYYDIVNGNARVTYQRNAYGDHIFYDSYPTGSLTIPSSVTNNSTTYSVTSINSYAFYGCTGLTSVIIPNSITSIGYCAFYGCTGLTEPLYNDYCFAYFPSGYSSTYSIPNGITQICGGAFRYCSGLNSVTIPNSVTSIGLEAFYNCTDLTSISIPASVTQVREECFDYCTGLTAVYYTGSVSDWCRIIWGSGYGGEENAGHPNPLYYAHNLYINNELVTDLVIPDDVTEIKSFAFTGATCLTSLTISNSVTSIGDDAFNRCSGLTGELVIPNSVTKIGDYPGCTFAGCSGLTSITIPPSVKEFGLGTFLGCHSLSSVKYTGTLTEWISIDFVGTFANPLYYAHNLYINNELITSIEIPQEINVIKDDSFCGATCLTSVSLPNTIDTIGIEAFKNCTGLTSITIPPLVTYMSGAFDSCSNLVSVNYNAVNCNKANGAFRGCNNLETLNIGDNVRIIPDWIFYCNGLSSVIIPNSVINIGAGAFYECSNLSFVIIPSSVSTIGNEAFKDCSNLAEIHIENLVPPSIVSSTFENIKSTCLIYIPCGRTSNYSAAQYWSDLQPHFIEDCGNNGIDDITSDQIKIYSRGSEIVIEGAENSDALIYDVMGRIIHKGRIESPIHVNNMGVYMVKVGDQQPRKVIVR